MLPDQPCPVLVLTGQARNAAARALRMLLDPVTHPLLVLPRLESQFHKLALSNRILAFSIGTKLSEGRREALANLSAGVDARLTQCSKRRDALQTNLRRPVLIAAETPIEITGDQVQIEINHAEAFDPARTFTALLDELVKFLAMFQEPEARQSVTSIILPPELMAPKAQCGADPPVCGQPFQASENAQIPGKTPVTAHQAQRPSMTIPLLRNFVVAKALISHQTEDSTIATPRGEPGIVDR